MWQLFEMYVESFQYKVAKVSTSKNLQINIYENLSP